MKVFNVNLIDLTREIKEGLLVYPGQPQISLKKHYKFEEDGRNLEKIEMSSHFGTHIDAPFHFVKNGKTAEMIGLEDLCGKAIRLNIEKSENGIITKGDLLKFDKDLNEHKRVIINTNWKQTKEIYYIDYPVLNKEAVLFLIEKNIKLLGMDTPSPGPKGIVGEEIHKLLLNEEIIILEGLMNLERLPSEILELICLPLKIIGTSGAPCRVVARIN